MVARPNLETNSTDFRPAGNSALSAGLWNDMQSSSLFTAGDSRPQSNLLLTNDIYAGSATKFGAQDVPLLGDALREQIGKAADLSFSTPADNKAAGQEPDYRMVVDAEGKISLEKIGSGDPLADGKLNIEMDPKDKSLEEAIKNADKNLKEYIREMMSYFRQNHPGKEFPGWWTDIMNSQPDIPQAAQPVPIRQAESNTQAAVTAQEKPADASQEKPASNPTTSGSNGGSSGGSSGGGGGGRSIGGAGRGGGDGVGAGYNSNSRYRGDGGGNTTYSGATPNADSQTVLDNVATVVKVAKEVGVDPKLAVAMMLVESGGDNKAIGDNNTSFGLFQLHQGGMLTEAKLTPQQAFDPETNARVSLGNLAKIDDKYNDPGAAAAASQRPAEPANYARKVNASMDEAAQLIAASENRSSTDSVVAGNAPTPTEMSQKLVSKVQEVDANMAGTGYCAAAVQTALADCGLPEFLGTGNAWQMKEPLLNSGKFQQVAMADAQPGDIIIRPPSSNPNDDSVHGDISVVTGKKGNRITQTNDATYEFDPNNPRYDGKAVFLRYTGTKTA